MVESLSERKVKISPSILNVSFERLESELNQIEENIEYIHIDVMDGKFVTNQTNGVQMFEKAKENSSKPLDVHLMVEDPINEIEKYKGAEIITFHLEAMPLENREEACLKVIEKIKSVNAKVGISIKPKTLVSELINFHKILDKIDLILIMTVEPGYGGQKFNNEMLQKVIELRKTGFQKLIEVDGGVTVENSKQIRDAGVDIIVAGTAIFSAEDKNRIIRKLKGV